MSGLEVPSRTQWAPPGYTRCHLRRLFAALLIIASVAALIILYLFDPQTAPFYPVCFFHQATGLDCPGCGALRALHALLHGHLVQAIRFNALFILTIPVTLWLGARAILCLLAGRPFPRFVTRPMFAWLAAGAIIIWGIARNLPFLIHNF